MNKPMKIRTLKLVKVGNSAGVILPKELLAEMGIDIGDNLSVQPSEGGIKLEPDNSDFEKQMAVAREVMAKRKRTLHELAK